MKPRGAAPAHLYPWMRRTGATGIVRGGSVRKIVECVCGMQHSYAANWPKPYHAYEWEDQHEATCGAVLAAATAERNGNWAYLAAEEIIVLDGMPTLSARRLPCADGRLYRAAWLSGATRCEGYLWIGREGTIHAESRAELRELRAARRAAAAEAAAKTAHAERVRVILARLAILPLPDYWAAVEVGPEDSRAVGNCPTGTASWLAAHAPGRESLTIGEILSADPGNPRAVAACVAAIVRAGLPNGRAVLSVPFSTN